MHKDIINNMSIESYSFNSSLSYSITKSLTSLEIDYIKEVTLNEAMSS